jgi:hypothetical protein
MTEYRREHSDNALEPIALIGLQMQRVYFQRYVKVAI